MDREPCVKLGIRISPKINEKPADNKKSNPPKATLLPASTSHRFIATGGPSPWCVALGPTPLDQLFGGG